MHRVNMPRNQFRKRRFGVVLHVPTKQLGIIE
jgi:hypothetical protein